ncbi:LysR family transcriptional regulator [Aliidiomarina halalkaliphila]|uniref:LysR family transcriptional regulator n=1 Tax=Aliidiomarina halalkaliphila TaxID=2593535 RepID=A0A552X3R2_9GAMM|nr:LysR family transcriptional regulator [Aliidiomarina halalkaliphila]TRW49529.1 LysR family transcriptional regulator [Aliidiomarina halalkaliphila]
MNQIHLKTDLNLLRVLAAIYRERQLNRAAVELSLTPSAISHALRRLREQFDDPLFVRHGRVLRPTALCDKLAPDVHELLMRMQGLIERGRHFHPKDTRRSFRLGIPEAIEPELFPRIFRHLKRLAPNARFESIAIPHAQLSDFLLNRQADLAIDVPLPLSSPVHQRPLYHEDFVVLGRQDNKELLTKARYLGAQHIAVSSRARGTVLEDYLLRELGIERRLAVRVQSYQTAGHLVAISGDYLTLPRRIAERLVTQFPVRLWEMPAEIQVATRLQMYWHDAHETDPALQWLSHQVHEILAN